MDIALSRPQFEMMTGDLLSRTVTPVQNALRDAGISASQLGKVHAGGRQHPEAAGAAGAGGCFGSQRSADQPEPGPVRRPWVPRCQAALLQVGGSWRVPPPRRPGLVLMDVTPLTLSIETLGGVATPLITRNSMIPTRKSQIFTTARPMQTSVEINVLQGERHFARDNKSLGKFKLNGIRQASRLSPRSRSPLISM